ncbi:MAG TPA: hypothetical protein VM008_17640 [Phycisphaerae bacterium]|nr:hypothetical protein [Phycisphaerae bacterium]
MPTPSLTPIPTSPPKPVKKTWRRFFKRLGFGLAGLFAILLVVFFLLPQWISNDQGRIYILQQLNKRMRGGGANLSVGDWTLRWFHAAELHNVTLTLPDGTIAFASPHVRSELTLWSLFWGNYDFGTTTLDTPQFTCTRYPDGTTSFDALTALNPGASLRKILNTLRGAIQFSNGTVTFNSLNTRQSITYTNVKAAFTIASPDAPCHIQFEGIAPDRTISLAVSLQPIRNWNASNWPQALAMSDFECSATNLPTALFCDWSGLDPRWQDSFGPTFSEISLSNHAAPPSDARNLSIQIRGSNGFIDADLAARAANMRSPATLAMPNPALQHFDASLAISSPLAQLLRHVNPLFSDLDSGTGPLTVSLSDLSLNSANSRAIQLSARFNFPPMTFRRAGLTAKLLNLASVNQVSSPTLPVSVEPFRLRLLDGAAEYDNLTLTFLHRRRITFRGMVHFNGRASLMATVPADSGWGDSSLGAVTAEIPITGTLDAPVVTVPTQ